MPGERLELSFLTESDLKSDADTNFATRALVYSTTFLFIIKKNPRALAEGCGRFPAEAIPSLPTELEGTGGNLGYRRGWFSISLRSITRTLSIPARTQAVACSVLEGTGGNRTRAWRFCRPQRYHFATVPNLFS